MESKLPACTPQIIFNIEEEVRLNREVAKAKGSIQKMKQELLELKASYTLKERVGLSAESLQQKHTRERELEQTIERKISSIRERAEQWKQIQQQTERLLEKFLSDSDTQFKLSAKLKVFFRDLRKRLGEFHHDIIEYRKSLGQARAAMCAQYDRQTKLFHHNALQRFEEAAIRGNQVDEAIKLFNRMADGYADQVHQTFLEDVALPRLTKLYAKQNVYTIRQQEIAKAHQQIDQIIDKLEQLYQEEVPILDQQIQAADTEHDEITTRYVERYWERLRECIWADLQRGISHMPGKGQGKLKLKPRPAQRDVEQATA